MKYKYIFEVKLINYLNRFINHENLFEFYSNDLKLEIFDSKSSVCWPANRNNQQEITSFIIHDKSNEINPNSCNYIDFIFNSTIDN